jgi:hypothetical protein
VVRKRRGYYDSEPIECARAECEVKFRRRVHNQKYHSKKCCQISTNEKLLKKYHDGKKPIRSGRICKTRGCKTILSLYNRDSICASCQNNIMMNKLKIKK